MATEKQYMTLEDHQAEPVSRKRFPPDFTLLAQDISSPATICYWIGENIETASPEKLHDALDSAIMMRDYEHRRNAD